MAEHVLPVLAAHDDEVLAGGIAHHGDREVGDARVVIAPLGREQVDDGHAFRPRLEQRRRRRDEVDMAVDGCPSGIVRVDALDRQDHRRSVASDLDRAPQRPVAEAMDDLDVDGPDGQQDREPSGDVRVGVIAEDHVGAEILVEAGIDLVAMSERREVASIRRQETDPGGHRPAAGGIHDLDLDALRRGRQGLDRDAVESLALALRREAIGRHARPTDGQGRVRCQREVDIDRAGLAGLGVRTPADHAPVIVHPRSRRRSSPEDLAEVDRDRRRGAARPIDAQGPPGLDGER